jgi:rhodanese-related sulfurtransferase
MVTRLSPQEAEAKLNEGYTYLDVRTEAEFGEGHPQGAVNVPVALAGGGSMLPNADFGAVVAASFGKETKLVVGCKSGGRSMRAAQLLLEAGYTHVVELRPGFDGARDAFGQITEPGWSRAGLAVEKGQPEGRSYASLKTRAGRP